MKRAQEALEHNNTDYAQDIFINRLKKSKEEFLEWKKSFEKPYVVPAPKPVELKPAAAKLEKKVAPTEQATKKEKKLNNINCSIVTTRELILLAIELKDVSLIKQIVNKEINSSDGDREYNHLIFNLMKNMGYAKLLITALTDNKFFKQFANNPNVPAMFCALDSSCDVPALYYFLFHSPESRLIFQNLCQNQTFLDRLIAEEDFIPALLLPSIVPELTQLPAYSSFIFLSFYSEGCQALNRIFSNEKFLRKIKTHPSFITQLISPVSRKSLPDQSTSVLYYLTLTCSGAKVLLKPFDDEQFYTKLCHSDEFMSAFLRVRFHLNGESHNTSPFYAMAGSGGVAKEVLMKFFKDKYFIKKLCKRIDLIPSLLARIPRTNSTDVENENTSILYWLVARPLNHDGFVLMFAEKEFVTRLIEHEEFIPTLLALRNRESKLNYNESILFHLLNCDH